MFISGPPRGHLNEHVIRSTNSQEEKVHGHSHAGGGISTESCQRSTNQSVIIKTIINIRLENVGIGSGYIQDFWHIGSETGIFRFFLHKIYRYYMSKK